MSAFGKLFHNPHVMQAINANIDCDYCKIAKCMGCIHAMDKFKYLKKQNTEIRTLLHLRANRPLIHVLWQAVEAPAMPTSTTSLPSGSTVRVRRVASMKNLTESQASSIGLANYYHRYAFDWMDLSLLDQTWICSKESMASG